MDNQRTEPSGIKPRGKLTRHAKDFEGKTNGAFDDCNDLPKRSISSTWEMRGGAASILSTVGTRLEKEALPEFNRSMHMRYGSRHSGTQYREAEEIEVGSINLGSAAAAPGFDTNKVRMTPIPSNTHKLNSPTVGGKRTPNPTAGVKLTRYVNFDRQIERSVSRSRQ